MTRSVTIRGTLTTIGKPIFNERLGCWRSFSATAFNRLLIDDNSRFVPLQINHDSGLTVPTLSRAEFEVRDGQLHFRHTVDTSTAMGRAAASAIKHGYLSRMSIGAKVIDSYHSGDIEHIAEAAVDEVSLADRPADPGAMVAVVGSPIAHRRTQPESAIERATLRKFLRDIGIPDTDPAPAPATVAKSPATALAASVSRPAAKPEPTAMLLIVDATGTLQQVSWRDYNAPRPASPRRQFDPERLALMFPGFSRHHGVR